MSIDTTHSAAPADEMELVIRIWRRRRWVLAGTLLAVVLAIAYLLVAPRLYRVETIALPRDSNSGAAGLMAQMGQLGGLASTLGINLTQGSKEEPLAVMRSKGFSRRFLETHKLVQLVDESRWPWPSTHDSPATQTDFAVEHFMRNILSVSQDKKTGLVIVAVEWTDPVVAAEWANSLVRQLNEEMRLRSLTEANWNIAYLRQQIEATESVALRQSAAKLLENELNKKMMAAGSLEFAFRVVDEARPALRPNTPRAGRTLFWSLMFGGMFSIFAVLVFDLIARMRMNLARLAPAS